jgi:D-amino peptidase
MRVYILTDLEGAALVFRWEQVQDTNPTAKLEAMQQLTRELNSCIEGILSVQPNAEILVRDGHGYGGLIHADVHPRAEILPHANTKPPYCLDPDFDGLFVVGQHSMAGTNNGILAHTLSPHVIEHYRLNGQMIGEFGLYAFMAAGFYAVPTVFIAGDDKAAAEARVLIPDIISAEVKRGLGPEVGITKSSTNACEMIRSGAAEATRKLRDRQLPLMKTTIPYECEVRVAPGHEQQLDRYLALSEVRRIDDRTVMVVSDDVKGVLW